MSHFFSSFLTFQEPVARLTGFNIVDPRTSPQPTVDAAPNVTRFCIDLMEKRSPLGGLKAYVFYIEWTPDFGSNWGVGALGGNSVTGGVIQIHSCVYTSDVSERLGSLLQVGV